MEFLNLLTLLFYSFNVLSVGKGAIHQTLTYCCDLGKNYANSDFGCEAVKTPIQGIDKRNEENCFKTLVHCCEMKIKENDCRFGLNDAKGGYCNSRTGSERQQCCEACNSGKLSAQSGACDNISGLGVSYDKYFKSCCEEMLPKNRSAALKDKSERNNDQPSLESVCGIEDLCAQICTETNGSHKCDCQPGYILMDDGMSCKEVTKPLSNKKNDGCKKNNPCQHKCVDTGTTIFCTCNDGFQLAKDNRSCNDIDECVEGRHLCLENETCSNAFGYYHCNYEEYEDEEAGYDKACDLGYKFNGEKQSCEDINECELSLTCPASETCLNTDGGYECLRSEYQCPPGFRYKNAVEECIDIDECVTGQNDCNRESQVCLNNKGNYTCVDKASKTQCPAGFKMNTVTQTCQDIDECLEEFSSCAQNEICVNEPGGHTCHPKDYYPTSVTMKPAFATTRKTTTFSGTSPRITTFASNVPRTMITTPWDPKSTSPPKTSPRPSTSDPKTPEPTKNSKQPIPSCNQGFRYNLETKQCQDIDECAEDVGICDHHQDCRNTVGSYRCNCKAGYSKDHTTMACVDINECQSGDNDCTEGQRCDNTQGSYICQRVVGCGTGYTLSHESGNCEDDDECVLGTHTCDRLGNNMVCRNTLGSYRCERVIPRHPARMTPRPIYRPPVFRPPPPQTNLTVITYQTKQCLPGYYMDSGGSCRDIDECLSNPCRRNEKCINLSGRYECKERFMCRGGFELNEAGNSCVDINECIRGTHKCNANQICRNHAGYHVCLCPPGHQLINNDCVDVNECELSQGRVCSMNARCINTIGSYKCKCKDGFQEYRSTCVDIDECVKTPNLCEQICVNMPGGYRCSCKGGFTLNPDNRTCTDVNECERFADSNLCIGTCENIPGSYRCRCPHGYRLGTDGRTCQDINECETQRCHGRDQICFNTYGGFDCPSITCPVNYVRDPEHKSRCKRDPYKCSFGNCRDSPDQYTFHFISVVSNLPVTTKPVQFFQMRGPNFAGSKVTFNLKLESARCPSNVEKVTQNYFRVDRATQVANISFVRPMQGPQQVDLSFEMQLFNNGMDAGKVIAKIFMYISEYSF